MKEQIPRRKALTEIKENLKGLTDHFQDQLEIEKSKGNREHSQVCVEIISAIRNTKEAIDMIMVLQNKEGMQ